MILLYVILNDISIRILHKKFFNFMFKMSMKMTIICYEVN